MNQAPGFSASGAAAENGNVGLSGVENALWSRLRAYFMSFSHLLPPSLRHQ
jgi:hypothetical protein